METAEIFCVLIVLNPGPVSSETSFGGSEFYRVNSYKLPCRYFMPSPGAVINPIAAPLGLEGQRRPIR